MLASDSDAPRERLWALAERLSPGMSMLEKFGPWLERSPIDPSRFFSMIAAERRHLARKST
jgi:hypothetical protein